VNSIGPYQIVRELGRGGMGVVYLARDARLERDVAIKMPLREGREIDPKSLARFEREAKAVARLKHPNVVALLAAGDHQGVPFLVMEFVRGENLEQRVRRDGALPPDESARMVEQVARAVQHAHDHGVLHRDLKPENVLQSAEGRPFLTDFGLTKIVGGSGATSGLTAPGAAVGTLQYLPPEQLERGSLGATKLSDVYSLGATLYTLLVGRPAVESRQTRDVIRQILNQGWELPSRRQPDVDTALDAICATAMALDPADRYATAAALADDLARWLSGRPVTAKPIAKPAPPSQALAAVLEADLDDDPAPSPAQAETSATETLATEAPEAEAPQDASHHDRAKSALQRGELASALAHVECVLAAAPDDVEALLLRGVILRKLHRTVEAIRCYEHVLRLRPGDVRALVSRGVARTGLKDFIGAADDLRQALERVPADSPRRAKIERELAKASERLGSSELRGFRLPD
jgi:serine/threonine protein kinase